MNVANQLGASLGLAVIVTLSAALTAPSASPVLALAVHVSTAFAAGCGMLAASFAVIVCFVFRSRVALPKPLVKCACSQGAP